MISKSIVLLHTTLKYLRLFVKSAKLQQIQHCKNNIYIQRKLHVEHFLKNTDCEMVAFWQENTLNNRSHVALAGKELSGVVAVDWNLIQNINLQRVKML